MKAVEFVELEMKWPEVKSLNSVDDAKTLFKLGNTQYKKALEHFILDGYVTEHVTIKQGICALYKSLTRVEKDNARATLMH